VALPDNIADERCAKDIRSSGAGPMSVPGQNRKW